MRLLFLIGTVAALLTGCASQGPAASEPNAPSDPLEMAASYSQEHAGDALLVWQNGRLVLERYQNGFEAGEVHVLASGTKTFSGAMALAAVEDGLFSLDDPVARYVPAWQGDPQKETITIRQLLHLTGGLDTDIGRAPTFEEALRAPIVHPPGDGFRYGPTAFQVFGALLRNVLDGEDPVAYLERRLLAPIGAERGDWRYVDQRDPQLAGGARLTARDWLRFGRLLLNEGRWQGKDILDPELMSVLTDPTAASPGYGLTVWLNAAVDTNHAFFEHTPVSVQPDGSEGMIYHDGPRDLYMAAGLFNQRLYVLPSREMVVVRFGRADAAWSDAEFLARLLDGDAYDAPSGPRLSNEERVALLVNLQMGRLDRHLSLSKSQEEAIRPIVEEQMEALAELEEQPEWSEMSRRERRRLVRRLRRVQRRTDRTIEAELSDEQVEAYRSFREEQRERRREAWREQS